IGDRKIFGQVVTTVNDGSSWCDLRRELSQRDLVHRHKDVGPGQYRRADAIFGKADVAMSAAGAHLRAVGRQPADFEAFAHAHLGKELAKQKNALTPESGDLDPEMPEPVGATGDHVATRAIALAFDDLLDRLVWGNIVIWDVDFPVAVDVQRKIRDHLLADPSASVHGIFAPDRGTGREDLDKGKTSAIALQFERFAHG